MRFAYIELAGFRSYGPEPQRITFESELSVLYAENSQGKTGLAEAVEFLFSGSISRRQLSGGSPAEFQSALRNAHLLADAAVYVEVGLIDENGTRILRRTLVADFEGASDCSSVLTCDGVPISSVVEVGLFLSDPPLEAPVLLEHALRYAVSAKPGERSEYFKAILEVADLDLVRRELASVISERERSAKAHILTDIEVLADAGILVSDSDPRRAQNAADVDQSLIAALDALVPADPTNETNLGLASARSRVANELVRRQQDVSPVQALNVTQISLSRWGAESNALSALVDPLDRYMQLVQNVDRVVADVLPLLKVALETPSLALATDHPVDCPLCETALAVTPDRMQQLRSQVADREGLVEAAGSLRELIGQAKQELAVLGRWIGSTKSVASAWADEDNALASTFEGLGGDTQTFSAAQAAAHAVVGSADRAHSRNQSLELVLRDLEAAVSEYLNLESETSSGLAEESSRLEEEIRLHAETIAEFDVASSRAAEQVVPALNQRANTQGWQQLLDLSADPAEIWRVIRDHQQFEQTNVRLRRAQRAVDVAVREIMDRRLETMAGEIRKWWLLLRPDELTVFDSLSRRGAGNRFLDLTAALAPDVAAPGVVRNALAVLSNSQLNALGLATFLARCQLLETPVVFLDDPVPGSDREHRLSFASSVVAELRASGKQVVVTTHDPELARSIQTLHQHSGVDEYGAALLDPREGTRVTRTGDSFEHLMLDASSQMGSPLVENRRAAGNSLRIATERLAKHIIVDARRRDGDQAASIADYDGRNLATLRPLVIEQVVEPNEPGQWAMFSRILNDADHDAPPPLPAELKQVYHSLRHVKKIHGTSTA